MIRDTINFPNFKPKSHHEVEFLLFKLNVSREFEIINVLIEESIVPLSLEIIIIIITFIIIITVICYMICYCN